MIAGLLIGMFAGLAVAGVFVVLFTDTTLEQYIMKFSEIDVAESAAAFAVGAASFVVSLFALIMLHEAGHLVGGLMSGYRFVSFRVFNYTFIKVDGRLRVKKFAIAGTGGQCLLAPPDVTDEAAPVTAYNLGGLAANVLVLSLLPLLWLDLNPFLMEFLVIFLLTDVVMLIINGIPMSAGGVGNDAYNQRLLGRSQLSRRGLLTQLRANALIQNGVRPKDMPADWFAVPAQVDYANALEVALPIMSASRLMDAGHMEESYRGFSDLYGHRKEIMALYVKEIACELAFLAMVTGREDEARRLLDGELMKYVGQYRRMMSSKERLLCAKALFLDNDRPEAERIYAELDARKDAYLLQGEVRSDLALMRDMLGRS